MEKKDKKEKILLLNKKQRDEYYIKRALDIPEMKELLDKLSKT